LNFSKPMAVLCKKEKYIFQPCMQRYYSQPRTQLLVCIIVLVYQFPKPSTKGAYAFSVIWFLLHAIYGMRLSYSSKFRVAVGERWAVSGGERWAYQSRGRFVKYDKYRVFPTSIFMPGFRRGNAKKYWLFAENLHNWPL
jgi:hypothetical protein